MRSILDSRGRSHSFHLPIGVGYLGWKLDEAGEGAYEMLDAALDYNVRAVWLAYGDSLGKYVDYIRKHDDKCGRHTVIFINVNSVSEALRAVNEWKPDVIVAQGTLHIVAFLFRCEFCARCALMASRHHIY